MFKLYNLNERQFVRVHRKLAARFEQSQATLGPYFGHPVTEQTNEQIIDGALWQDRGLVELYAN